MRFVSTTNDPVSAKGHIDQGISGVIRAGITAAVDLSHDISVWRNWWANEKGEPIERNVGELLCLMHSELSEAMEAARKDLRSTHIPDFSAVEEELADLLVRVFDFAGGANLRLAEAFVAKTRYNLVRADHDPSVRAAAGGKQF
jgi:NTP pyrophosphatase (non-canonical NTP hydrolase)